MNQIIIDRLSEIGLKPTDLTDAEVRQLEKELLAEQAGALVLDGVLSNPEIYYRRKKIKESN